MSIKKRRKKKIPYLNLVLTKKELFLQKANSMYVLIMKCSLIMFSLSIVIQASEDLPSYDLSPQNMSMAESDQTLYNNPCPENISCFNCCQEMCECIDTYAYTRFCAICCVESCKFMVDPSTIGLPDEPDNYNCFQRYFRYFPHCLTCSIWTAFGLMFCPCMMCLCTARAYGKYEEIEQERNSVPEFSTNKKKAISPGSK